MEVEARKVHFLGPDSDIKTVKSCKNAFMHLASIFELRPFAHNSESALLLKVRITPDNVSK